MRGSFASFSAGTAVAGCGTRARSSGLARGPPRRSSLASSSPSTSSPRSPNRRHASWGPATTVNDAIEGWKQNGWDDLSPVTTRRYENVWNVHIKKAIGRERIATLTPYDVERYFRDLKAEGCGRETVRYVRSVLNRACRLARKWSGNQLPNPISDTELPTWGLEHTPEPVRAPTREEVRTCWSGPRISTSAMQRASGWSPPSGVRRGEACALRWSDIDWQEPTLTIDESVIASGQRHRQVSQDQGQHPAGRRRSRHHYRAQELRMEQQELAVGRRRRAARQRLRLLGGARRRRSRPTPTPSAGPSPKRELRPGSRRTCTCTRFDTSRRRRSTR